MNRRATTLGVASAILVALLVLAIWVIHVPYVVLVPGPVTDTLGTVPAGDVATGQPAGGPVIDITGAKVQPSSGHLYLTTVGLEPGDCSDNPTFGEALQAWWNSDETVQPKQVQCPPGKSSAAVQQQAEQEMTDSQINAVYAAMTELGYKATGTRVVVSSVGDGVPAAKLLQRNDQILTVSGQPLKSATALVNDVRALRPGQSIALGIDRAGVRRTVVVPTYKNAQGKTMLGIGIDNAPTFGGVSVTIGIDPDAIGGPSAGTALALGIVDKLTPGGLTGGKTIAGTGTISRAGKIGPIGGIQQKIAAAVKAHATVFFAPSSECADAKSAAPSSLTLIRGTTLSEVVSALKAIKSGSTNFPHC